MPGTKDNNDLVVDPKQLASLAIDFRSLRVFGDQRESVGRQFEPRNSRREQRYREEAQA